MVVPYILPLPVIGPIQYKLPTFIIGKALSWQWPAACEAGNVSHYSRTIHPWTEEPWDPLPGQSDCSSLPLRLWSWKLLPTSYSFSLSCLPLILSLCHASTGPFTRGPLGVMVSSLPLILSLRSLFCHAILCHVISLRFLFDGNGPLNDLDLFTCHGSAAIWSFCRSLSWSREATGVYMKFM